MLDHLLQEIVQKVSLTTADKALCAAYFEEIKVSKNSILEEQEKKHRFLYFVHSGFMRLFYYDEKGNEITTHFTSPNGFITSFLSFVHEKPAMENVECITDCQLLRISRTNLARLINESDNFKTFSVSIFEQVIAMSQVRANDLATLPAELRYKKLLTEQPQLLQHIPIGYIASFLGIKSQSLSRIRRQLIL